MYAKRMKKDEQIMIHMEEAIVNQSEQIYMGKEEIFQIIAQEKIGACHMSAYIMALLIYQNQVVGSKKVKKSTTWSKIQYFSDCLWPNYGTEQIDELIAELARHILYFAS